MNIQETNRKFLQQTALPNTEHHHYHADAKKACCGDCKGQGSCGKLTKVSLITETPKDIATLK